MTQNSILVYKNWTCSFSPITYSLKYSGLEILDNEADHHELVKSLLFFINKKQKSRCKFFRITDDVKNITVVVSKTETLSFMNYLKEISYLMNRNKSMEIKIKQVDKINSAVALNDLSMN